MRWLVVIVLVVGLVGEARAQWGWTPAPAPNTSWDWEPAPVPKPAPKWVPYANGWWKSAASGHWWHGHYGHYDRDTVWSEGGSESGPVLTQWEQDHAPEPPLTHIPEYMNRPPVYWTAPVQPTFYAPPVSFGGLRGGGRFFFRGGGAGGCST